MNIIDEIEAHEKEVYLKKNPDDLHLCPKCNANAQNIKFHERRYRLFYIINDRIVSKVLSLLGRWKCLCCNSTFTYYPQFAIPYKRYVKGLITSLSRQYLEKDDNTYRDVIKKGGMAIVYEINNNNKKEHYLEHTTVWRWLSFIGSLEKTLREALNLIKQKSSTSELFRKVRPVSRRKYRSDERRKLLQKCMQLFNAEDEFENIFEISIFPHLATRCSWG